MKTVLIIGGMHCASCASNIEKILKKISGIENVNVNVIMNKAFIESKRLINEEEIRKAISRIGYKVLNLEVE